MIVFSQAVGGLALLYFGGEWLIRGASALAMRLGVSPLVIGLTVVAFGTSAPELAVSIDAALGGAQDIALGNVVGSNIANVALILGLAALLRPIAIHAKIVRVDAPLVLAVSLVLLGCLADGGVSRFEASLLVLGLLVYLIVTFVTARRESRAVRQELAAAAPAVVPAFGWSLVWVAGGLVSLVFGGRLLVAAAVEMATLLGVSQAVIGVTVVAVGTSLPELATSMLASVRGQGDIAIGNVVGSNLFNILGILGLTAVLEPLGIGALTWIDLAVMAGLAAALAVLVATGRRLDRIEGAVLLAVYALYTGWLLVG